jgi:hypothetical protein
MHNTKAECEEEEAKETIEIACKSRGRLRPASTSASCADAHSQEKGTADSEPHLHRLLGVEDGLELARGQRQWHAIGLVPDVCVRACVCVCVCVLR